MLGWKLRPDSWVVILLLPMWANRTAVGLELSPPKQPPTHSWSTSQPLSVWSTWLHALKAQGSTHLALISHPANRSLDEGHRAPGPLVLSSLWCPEWVSRHRCVEGIEEAQRNLLLSVDTRLFCETNTVQCGQKQPSAENSDRFEGFCTHDCL